MNSLGIYDDDYAAANATLAGYNQQYKANNNADTLFKQYQSIGYLTPGYFNKAKTDLAGADAEVSRLDGFRNTTQWNENEYNAAVAKRQSINESLVRNTLVNTGGKGRTGASQKILDAIHSGDQDTWDYINQIGGIGAVDWTVFEADDKAANQFQNAVTALRDKRAQEKTDAENVAKQAEAAAANQQVADGYGESAQQAAAQQQKIYDNSLAQFDQDIVREFGQLGQSAIASSSGAGFRDAGAVAAQLGAEKSVNSAADRIAKEKDARGTLNSSLGDIFSQAEQFAEQSENLSADQKLQITQQASSGLIQQINNAIQSGQIDAEGQQAQVANLLSAYQNERLSSQQKMAILSRIVKIVLGAGAAGAGAAIAAGTAGAASPVGGALIASGASQIAGAASG